MAGALVQILLTFFQKQDLQLREGLAQQVWRVEVLHLRWPAGAVAQLFGGVALKDQVAAPPDPGSREIVDLAKRLPLDTRQMTVLAENATEKAPSPLQNYILARFEGMAGPAWLDNQTIEQAACATEMLGAVLEFGAKVNLAELSASDWHHAACIGWDWTSRGEAGLREAFSLIQARQSPIKHRRNRLPGQSFGVLYRWLASQHVKSDRGPIRDVLRDHILETEPVTTNRKILGKFVQRNRIERCEPQLY